MKQISTFTDESGQDTKGKEFVVCTVVVEDDSFQQICEQLTAIETESKKTRKWSKSDKKRRQDYLSKVSKYLKEIKSYYSVYSETTDYANAISLHIVSAIQTHTTESKSKAKIFLDTQSVTDRQKIQKHIRASGIDFKNVKSIRDELSLLIRLADALCGMIRDSKKETSPDIYKKILKKLIQV